MVPPLGDDRLLSHPFQFISHPIILRYILDTESAVQLPTNSPLELPVKEHSSGDDT
jgi:hypothetical protein